LEDLAASSFTLKMDGGAPTNILNKKFIILRLL
jgi:hypothetical protein